MVSQNSWKHDVSKLSDDVTQLGDVMTQFHGDLWRQKALCDVAWELWNVMTAGKDM